MDTFWYDGGMKPQTPEELYEDNEDLADEGMLFIGDKGKILCDFRANKPRLIPKSRQKAFEGSIVARGRRYDDADDEWVSAITNGTKSRGSFEQVAPLAEAVTLATIALRVPYKRLLWDAARWRSRIRPRRTSWCAVSNTGTDGRRKTSDVRRNTCIVRTDQVEVARRTCQ